MSYRLKLVSCWRRTTMMTLHHGCATLMSHVVSSGGGTEFTTVCVPVLVADNDGHQRAPVSLSPAVGRPGGVTKDSKRLRDSTVTTRGHQCLPLCGDHSTGNNVIQGMVTHE